MDKDVIEMNVIMVKKWGEGGVAGRYADTVAKTERKRGSHLLVL